MAISDMSESLKVPYGSDLHTKLRAAIRDRFDLSEREMMKYYDTWRDAEERFVAYRKVTDGDEARKVKRDDGNPQFTTIEIPYSYAMLMTAQTYWTTVFLGRSPIFQYSARHGESQDQVMGVEALMDYQLMVGEMMVPLYIWLLDQGKYGLGVICNYWDEEEVVVSNIEERPVTYLGIPVPGKTQRIRSSKRIAGYKGNKLFNVKPFNFFPDPRVPIKDFQRGEFCARKVELSWNEVIKGEAQGRFFNIDPLRKHIRSKQNQEEAEYSSDHIELPAKNEYADDMDQGFTSAVEMYVELIPSEWEMGSSKYPEKWLFTLATDEIIIGARPSGAFHGKFPYQVQEYEQDGYALVPRSMMEIVEPLNDTLSWLVNTHFHSVRKVLNDQMVYDPSRIVGKDLRNPTAGRLIRLKPEAYGTDARTALHQLQVTDVTANHLRDSNIVADMMQRVTGVTDNIMGMVNSGGRKTATEVRTSSSFGTNRLKMHAEYNGALGWSPLSQMMLQNTQQYYDQEQKFKVAGDALNAKSMVDVTPEMIQGFYDFVPVDGTLPVDRFAMANLWREMMAQMAKIPPLMQQYDMGSIFAYTAKMAGAKNIDQFKINVQPDEVLRQQMQEGNVVPLGGGDGSSGGAVSETPGISEPGQVGGLGSTG
jgi:hypothetical protein